MEYFAENPTKIRYTKNEGLPFGGWSLSLQGGDAMITYFELVQISIQFVLAGIQLGMLIVAIIALLKK